MNTPYAYYHRAALCTLVIMTLATQATAQEKEEHDIDIQAHLKRANKLLEYNGISRAAVLYEEVLRAEPRSYPDVAFVLGQIYEYKEDPARAALYYAMYVALDPTGAQAAEADSALERLRQPDWQRLEVIPPKHVSGEILLDDMYIVSDATEPVELYLPPKDYNITIKLDDHHQESYAVDLAEGGLTLTPRPESILFYGHLYLNVRKVEDAHIQITQERVDTSQGLMPVQYLDGSPGKPLELPTGTYFIRITHPEYEQWVRRVHIERDLDVDVTATMTKALPPELYVEDIMTEEIRRAMVPNASRLISRASKEAEKVSSQVARGEVEREEVMPKKMRLIATY